MNPIPHITLSILESYYLSVMDLRTYLSSSFNLHHVQISTPESAYTCLMNTAYVATSQAPNKSLGYFPPAFDMREIIDQAQTRLFKSKSTQNILTLGYRLASHAGDRGRKGMARIGITNTFVNTMITALQAPEWEELLHHIGIDAMLHLLTETSVFLSLPNGCLCQVTGVPVIFVTPIAQNDQTLFSLQPGEKGGPSSNKKRSLPALDKKERPYKRQKLHPAGLPYTYRRQPGMINDYRTTVFYGSTPADVVIMRARIFYSRPNFIPHTNCILVGLPLKHVLNRLQPSFDVNAGRNRTLVIDTRKQAEQVRHLSKYVFARQYGLATPFHLTAAKGTSFKFAHYLDREAEIKGLGLCKTPKRLKDILPLLEKLLKRHQKCRYVPLRDKACSSKVKSAGNQDLDSSVILELMSEHSIQLRSQDSLGANTSVDSSGHPIPPFGLTQARKHARNKPRFIEFTCSYVEVHRFVVLVTNAIIPKSFWGTKSNFRLVLQSVKQLISCRRYESLNLHHLLQGFSTSACDWLIPPGPGAQGQARISVSDSLKRRELLEDFLFWYFDSFVLPLLKTTFYVTESSAFRNQVLYFRHDDWTTLCAPLIERLTSVTFEKLTDAEATEIFRQRKLGFSFVRLLPKETGVRPIVNLRRRKNVTRGSYTVDQSINQILQAAFNILTYERSNQPHLLGASVLGPDDVHIKLKEFKANLPRDSKGSLPRLYFVKVDVQACFDTIDQTKLLQILRELISEDLYMTQRYGQLNICLGKTKRSYVKKALPQDDHPHFLRYATDLANVLRNTIFVDQVVYPLSKKQEVLQLLEEHITENIVKIGQNYYRQTIGIPQGSVLSSILCSFFYGDLEKKFSGFTKDFHSVLLRLIDDYLFITTNLTSAKRFLDMMKKGHPEYGCFISQDKTLTNFDHDDQLLNVVDSSQRTFPWCGYVINMRDLSIMVDYSRYNSSGVKTTLTVERGRRPGGTFIYKLLQMAKAKSHPIFADRELNTEYVVYLNIYQNSLMTAMKMHEYLRTWCVNKRRNNIFLRDAIRRAVMYNYTSVRAQSRKKDCLHPKIHKEAVLWLSNHAFHHILSRKPHSYKSLLVYLGFEINRPRYRHRYHRKFKSLVREGQVTFTQFVS